jgi:hypothetical protein
MSTYKLYYFNGRGHGEISRLIFATVGQKFEYIRYERDQWASHKAKKPLDQVTLLKFDGNKLPQSMSIACFLTKQFNLAGKDNFEQTKVDAVVDTINDTLAIYISIYFEEDAAKQQEVMQKFFAGELRKFLQKLEVLGKLYGNSGPYFVVII